MAASRSSWLVLSVAMALVAALVAFLPASAKPRPDCIPGSYCFDAGVACDFKLQVVLGDGGEHRISRAFFDREGNEIRWLGAGTGTALVFTNVASGATFSTEPNGSVSMETPNPDGTTQSVLTGHWIMFMFPTDVPAGPSTTLYVGRVVYSYDSAYNTVIQETSGTATDICAVLSD